MFPGVSEADSPSSPSSPPRLVRTHDHATKFIIVRIRLYHYANFARPDSRKHVAVNTL